MKVEAYALRVNELTQRITYLLREFETITCREDIKVIVAGVPGLEKELDILLKRQVETVNEGQQAFLEVKRQLLRQQQYKLDQVSTLVDTRSWI